MSTAVASEVKFHDFANVFPLITGEEFDSLVADIREHGLREKICLHPDGSVLDGRNRYRACESAGVTPQFSTYDGPTDAMSLLSFVVSMNLHRRHLAKDSLGCCAAEADAILERLEREAEQRKREGNRAGGGDRRSDAAKNGHGKKLPQAVKAEPEPQSRDAGRVNEQAAKLFGTNRQYVADAKKLRAEDPALFAAVKTGEKKLVHVKREQKEKEREDRREQNRQQIAATPAISVVAGKAKFATITIDPPWDWGDEGDCDQLGRARPTYGTMSIEQLLEMPVGDFADVDCHIYLWITNRSLPKGFSLLDKWGFRYVTCLTWCKPSFGMGNYFRGSTEQILFGVKGSQPLKRKDVGTWFEAARGPKGHSSKPVEFYDLVESCSPGPYLEIFARSGREGWSSYGAEV